MRYLISRPVHAFVAFLSMCLLSVSFTLSFHLPEAAGITHEGTDLAYTYKARNLKPADFGYEGRTWEMVLRQMNDRLEQAPEDLNLLLERAIAYREFGVRRSLLLRKRDWKRSRQDFEHILAADSSFKDVLFQYAMLRRYQQEFDHAFDLMHRQVAIDPSSAHTMVSLFRMYHQFLHEKDSEEVSIWLQGNTTDFAAFVDAERLRKRKQFRAADDKLVNLLKTSGSLPPQPVLLARARVYYGMGEPKIAESFVEQAIEIIKNKTQAHLVLEDFKYILSDAEIEAFLELDDAASFRSFFYGVIRKRNPTRSAEVNRRLTEHFRRLLEAEKTYAFYEAREAYRVGNNVSKDKMAESDFPLAYWLNGEFGDKGLVFIRHGDPLDKVGSVTNDTPFIESWRYNTPKMDFHFEGHGSLAELIPTLPLVLDVLEARETWGGIYSRLASTARRQFMGGSALSTSQIEMDFITFENELFDESLENVQTGLTTDRHQWSDEANHLPLPYFVAAFQGEEEATDVEVYFSVPIGTVSEALEGRERLGIEVGLSVHDMNWNEVYSSLETLHVDANRAKDAVAVDYIRFEALPDSYHVNLHARITDTEWLGSYQFEYTVPDYSETVRLHALMISDLVPAFEVTPMDRPSRYAKKGLYLRTNPGRGYRAEDPFFIYFEIYNLTFASNDLTDFEITYTLRSPDGQQKRKGLFRRGGNEPALSISYERQSEDSNLAEYGEIDMSAVPDGLYELEVTVTDKNTGESVSNVRVIQLG